MTLTYEDRICGSLLAGALGDAIGAHFEGRPADPDFEIPGELRVTDDTQLTIATCEAIVESGQVDPQSIGQSFARWFRQRRITGVGASTLKALIELENGAHWALVGATGEHSAGNGAAMRIAPLAFVLDPDDDSSRQTIRDVCRITHRNEEAYVGALAIVRAIRHAVAGGSLDSGFLRVLIASLPDSRVRDRLVAAGKSSFLVREYSARFASSGYVVDSVPLAILAAVEFPDFMAGVRQIILCGGDTDTIASMYGQIHGAAFGHYELPAEILVRVVAAPLVRETATSFSRVAAAL